MPDSMLLLGVDTCGSSGSVALAALTASGLEMLGQTELAGRTYSTTVVAAAGELLARERLKLGQVNAIVAVNGPGSFTGVRVGLSAVKGFGEPARIPVVAVSRLAVLAMSAGVQSAALDAHRHEVFLRWAEEGQPAREILAGREDLARINLPNGRIGVCEDAAVELLLSAWPEADLVRVTSPTAGDALHLAMPSIRAGNFVDLALLDGHYLRRSDAEIFGEPEAAASQPR
jgi:tRNA threonylcarbamoyladenosine biosynthesis protein TsaB